MLLSSWRLLTGLATPLVRRHLERRRLQGKEHGERWPERLGIDASVRPDGPLVWLHAASVGESLSILPLLHALRERRPDLVLLVTTGTVTSAALMAKRLPDGVLHRFAPVDLPKVVDRFLDHWQPDLALMIESEIWPNTLAALAGRHVPAVLLNARMSQRSFRRWRCVKPAISRLLGTYRLVLAQSQGDADRLRALGILDVATPGNLKYAAPPLPADPAELDALGAIIPHGSAWLAASTHAGEEELVARVHRALLASHPDLVTIIAPRHPHRGTEIAAALHEQGHAVSQRSKRDVPLPGVVHLADTLGELGLFYRLCPIVFVGGSLVPHGGQNPLEPARLGCALTIGPHAWNFAEIVSGLVATGGAVQVADEAGLAAQVAAWLADRGQRQEVGEAARRFAVEHAGVLERTMEALLPLLPVRR
ncbi:MAG TPA: 3-deoxy-D-manno-octulosonic acid transferase [Geminicoccus sp.]|jgi:3-deoxy-D-manno-octulosonic-acid transferase|uniref:3-deoxy-D-manno-octulosonic acid transferase n=1 Tax=Geminicoccus sp. TaxID=2024832 RepID=UPI002E3326E9|nr:3-deoxy-D-manno-octulosonic acid transferase [Geminicoccus sp.]HEX2526529.1 3-deoxy-D-manno-octulosonic acid transferase [Geminicoccus sp.]